MKKIFSLIAIVITLMSVGYMIWIDNETETNNVVIENQGKETINQKNNINKEKIKEEANAKKDKKETAENKEIKNNDESKSSDTDENTRNQNVEVESEENENKKSKEETIEKTATVFKVDKNTIASRVSFEDKARLLIYSRSLSTTDEAQIKELMKSSDELNSSIKIFKILKLKLDKNDYNSVKNILSPYIDVNLIEKNLK